ncbi:MAG TPA: hypothetical protein VHO48_03530 [Anaerolineaceae bacterium]|nr:hypothetical protein [Anaerolineaceae bacterium]
MKRVLNSNGYGGKILAAGGVFGLLVPGLLWLFAAALRAFGYGWPGLFDLIRGSMITGGLILAGLFILVAVELAQDELLFRRTRRDRERGVVLRLADGGLECPRCGNRRLSGGEAQCPICAQTLLFDRASRPHS